MGSRRFTVLQAKATTFLLEKCVQQCFFCFVKKDRPLVTVCDNFVTICVPSFSPQLLLFSLVKKGKLPSFLPKILTIQSWNKCSTKVLYLLAYIQKTTTTKEENRE